MRQIEKILENKNINKWIEHFKHAPHQVNVPHESDSELIEIPGDARNYLAVTIDSVAEEITTGLYQTPYTMGWVTIMACVSDLAAVGAEPLGVVIAVSVVPDLNDRYPSEIAAGMEEACRALGIYMLGGDTNAAPVCSLTACAIGIVPRDKAMKRTGCQPGEHVFITGQAGTGNALGLVRLAGLPGEYFPEDLYRPRARITEGLIIRDYASCCMDTSDGLLTTLDQLMRLNGLGFTIDCHWEKLLSPGALELCRKTKTPPWLMLAGPHGEFELTFTCGANMTGNIISANKESGFIKIGEVQQTPALSLILPSGSNINIDMAPIRNLLQNVGGDLEQYVKEFKAIGQALGLGENL
jgi:thiamine-monophosphate kinase